MSPIYYDLKQIHPFCKYKQNVYLYYFLNRLIYICFLSVNSLRKILNILCIIHHII
jgi:hypothetical protein